MTITHTLDAIPLFCKRASTPDAQIENRIRLVGHQAVALVAAIQERWRMRHFERFSSDRLQDIGFERDWDGSIIRLDRRERCLS